MPNQNAQGIMILSSIQNYAKLPVNLTSEPCIMIVFAVLAFKMQWALGVLMTACAGFLGALTGSVWRDLRGS
jgi:hypothetical protein